MESGKFIGKIKVFGFKHFVFELTVEFRGRKWNEKGHLR